MTDEIAVRLSRQNISLPEPAAPIAAYVPAILVGNLLYVSGQVPFEDGKLMTGQIGDDRDAEYGYAAARACAIMLLAQINKALGRLDRVERIVKLVVFVNSSVTFCEQSKVANGASELMERIFGEAGRHARSAVGVAALPMNAAVELEAIIAVKNES